MNGLAQETCDLHCPFGDAAQGPRLEYNPGGASATRPGQSYFCCVVAALAGVERALIDWVSGTSCRSMMITQSPMAVSIVAGRMRKWGVGARARRSFVIAHSKYHLVQKLPAILTRKMWALAETEDTLIQLLTQE